MKIICIGLNYSDHIDELKMATPQEPIFFLKSDTTLVPKNQPIYHPDFTKDFQYECELVVRINRLGKSIPERYAHKYYSEVAVGIDLTARDLQREASAKGLPWSLAKSFDYSSPLSPFVSLKALNRPIDDIRFSLSLNGKEVQSSSTSNMCFSVDQLIAYLSRFMTLKMGDLIFTGTPSGVGKLSVGDQLEAFIERKPMLNFKIH